MPIILPNSPLPNDKARQIVVAPRLPAPPPERGLSPFQVDGDIVVDCSVAGCGWNAMGDRRLVGKKWEEHYRTRHGADREVGVLLINDPRHQ